jgi:TatD DNase family protein
MLVDAHCHIHESSYPLNQHEVLEQARQVGVEKMICVGTTLKSSQEAIEFTKDKPGLFASIGVHPHDTKDGVVGLELLAKQSDKIVAVGEIGLDYYYSHSPRDIQIKELESQLQLAVELNLPVIFHVRDAFNDFWPVFDNFSNVRGVLHSFTDNQENLERALSRGLYIGVNGISTFTKEASQIEMFRSIPLERTLLETDAPFLTPSPFRGKVNTPSMVSEVAKQYALSHGVAFDDVCSQTTINAETLFKI